MLDKQSIDNKLFKLQESIKMLEELRVEGKEGFFPDKKTEDASLLNMFVSIELIVDIGNYILHNVFEKHPKTYKEVIEMLGEVGVVPKSFSVDNADMVSFRNIIAHDYDKLETTIAYEHLQKAPEIFRQFAKCYIEFIDK